MSDDAERRRRRNRRSLRVPVDEVPRPTLASAVTVGGAAPSSDDGGATVEIPAFVDDPGSSLDPLPIGVTIFDEFESTSVEEALPEVPAGEPVGDSVEVDLEESGEESPPDLVDEPSADDNRGAEGDIDPQEASLAPERRSSDAPASGDSNSSVVVVSRVVSVLSAPGSVAPPPPEPWPTRDTIEIDDTDLVVDEEVDGFDVEVDTVADASEEELELPSAEEAVAEEALELPLTEASEETEVSDEILLLSDESAEEEERPSEGEDVSGEILETAPAAEVSEEALEIASADEAVSEEASEAHSADEEAPEGMTEIASADEEVSDGVLEPVLADGGISEEALELLPAGAAEVSEEARELSSETDLSEELEVTTAPEIIPDAVEPEAEELPEELLEEADEEPKPPSKPPPPPSKGHAPPPPPEAEPRSKARGKAKPKRSAKGKRKPRRNWWEGLFNDDYLRTVPIPLPRTIIAQCDFIEQRFGLAPGATLLDVGCGLGLHAVELTRRGYLVVGLDLSLPMLSRAADEAQEHGFKINFLHADMREMNFDGAFDAVLCWGTTLGYFDDEGNRQVVERLYRALKPRGLLLLDVVNRDYVIRGQPNLVWFEGDGCVVMEETQMNYITSRLEVKRTVILDDGRQRDTRYSLRLYSLHELGQVLHHRGFRVVEVSGREAHPGVYFGADSPKLIILAERRPQGPPSPRTSPSEGAGAASPAPPSRDDAGADARLEDDSEEREAYDEPSSVEEPAGSTPSDPPSEAVNEALAQAIEQSEEELAEIAIEAELDEGE